LAHFTNNNSNSQDVQGDHHKHHARGGALSAILAESILPELYHYVKVKSEWARCSDCSVLQQLPDMALLVTTCFKAVARGLVYKPGVATE